MREGEEGWGLYADFSILLSPFKTNTHTLTSGVEEFLYRPYFVVILVVVVVVIHGI